MIRRNPFVVCHHENGVETTSFAQFYPTARVSSPSVASSVRLSILPSTRVFVLLSVRLSVFMAVGRFGSLINVTIVI